jgi:hypothetical protein
VSAAPKSTPPRPTPSTRDSEPLHSPLKPLLWMVVLFLLLIGFGAYYH